MPFTIPTIFTAIDKLTAPLRKMSNGVSQFADKAEAGIARQERMFRKLSPHLSEVQKRFLEFASAAALAGAVIGGITFSVDSIKEYEKSVASFRTIVSDLDNEAFKPFQEKINEVAKTTQVSAIDTAKAFEKIASLNAKFAETAEGIGAVSQAAITLSKASGDELGPSAESLVSIMNQFSFGAEKADRAINVLAAGAGVGAASIIQTAEAFTTFGSVAAGANITLEQSTALVQTLGKFSIFGSEAGTQLKGSIVHLQKAGLGYKTGLFNINEALEEAKKHTDKLRTAKEKDAYITKTFGLINLGAGRTLLNNIDLYKEFTQSVTGTSAAQEQAAIRVDTLSSAIDQLKAGWVNMITGSGKTTKALKSVKDAIRFVTAHLDTIVVTIGKVIGLFLLWKAIIIAQKIALLAYNAVMVIVALTTGTLTGSTAANTVAMNISSVATKAAAAAQWLWNAAMLSNPLTWMILIVMALVAALGYLIVSYKSVEDLHKESMQKNKTKAIQNEATQVEFLAKKYEKLGYSKKDALSKAIEISKKTVSADLEDAKMRMSAAAKAGDQSKVRIEEKVMNDILGRAETIGKIQKDPTSLSAIKEPKEIVNPTADQNQMLTQLLEKTNNAKLDINIKDPGNIAEAEAKGNNIKVKTSSTVKLATN